MSSIFNSIRYLILWITINKYYIVTGIFIIRIIALIILPPLLSGFNMSPGCSAALFSTLYTELHMYMDGHLYAVDLGGYSPEYNWPTQLEARRYDPIHDEFIEDGPSYTPEPIRPPMYQPNPEPVRPPVQQPNPEPVKLPVMEPPIQPPKPDPVQLPGSQPPIPRPKPTSSILLYPIREPNPEAVVEQPNVQPVVEQPNVQPVVEQPNVQPVVEQPNVQPVRPPVAEQPNVQPVRPPGPDQPNIGYHKYKLPASEEQRVELGEGSNSNAPSSKITFPIKLEALSTEQRNFAASYWEKQHSYQQVMNEIRKAKNIPDRWLEVEPELTRQRDKLWREIVELRVYASNNYNLEKVGDIRDLVAAVTGKRFR